jgi:hypothetical protein
MIYQTYLTPPSSFLDFPHPTFREPASHQLLARSCLVLLTLTYLALNMFGCTLHYMFRIIVVVDPQGNHVCNVTNHLTYLVMVVVTVSKSVHT